MDAIAAEIARKRKAQADAKAALAGGQDPAGGDAPRKWLKKGDLEKLRVAQYHEEEAAQAGARSQKAIVPQFRHGAAGASSASASAVEDSAASGGDGGGAEDGAGAAAAGSSSCADAGGAGATAAASGSAAATDDAPNEKRLKPAEVKRRLRVLGQPIQLFGEDDEERLERYRAVSTALPSESVVDDALKQGQMFDETQVWDAKGAVKQADNAAAVGLGHEDEDEEEELAPSFVATTPEQVVSLHFKQLLRMWGSELEARPGAEANSNAGRTFTAAYQQAKRHMRPFFKLLKGRAMPLDVLSTMVEITTFMKQREYVQAHDAYIRCAIGTAPWPMGITGTGIHERQGRQHLRESKVAHVMNDETQRKYLQSVKRLMTFAQKALPPAGPSKAVG